MASCFEIYRDKKKEFRFRLKASNGEIIAVSEGYKTKQSCLKGVESVKKNAELAEIVELDFDKQLLVSAARGDAVGVRNAIKNGAKLTAKDPDGNTAMHHAVLSGNKQTVQTVIKAGIKANARNKRGETPLKMAQAKSFTDIIAILQG